MALLGEISVESVKTLVSGVADTNALLNVVGGLFSSSVAVILVAVFLLQVFIALLTLNSGWDKFFLIFVVPWVVGILLYVVTFVFPVLPAVIGMIGG